MTHKEHLLTHAKALIIPTKLRGKLIKLIQCCPQTKLPALEVVINLYEFKQKQALELKLNEHPQIAKSILEKFVKASNKLLSQFVFKADLEKAEFNLTKELNDL